jgi:hypothetical protein
LPHPGFRFQPVDENIGRLLEINIEKRLRVGIFECPSVLIDPREATTFQVAQ